MADGRPKDTQSKGPEQRGLRRAAADGGHASRGVCPSSADEAALRLCGIDGRKQTGDTADITRVSSRVERQESDLGRGEAPGKCPSKNRPTLDRPGAASGLVRSTRRARSPCADRSGGFFSGAANESLARPSSRFCGSRCWSIICRRRCSASAADATPSLLLLVLLLDSFPSRCRPARTHARPSFITRCLFLLRASLLLDSFPPPLLVVVQSVLVHSRTYIRSTVAPSQPYPLPPQPAPATRAPTSTAPRDRNVLSPTVSFAAFYCYIEYLERDTRHSCALCFPRAPLMYLDPPN